MEQQQHTLDFIQDKYIFLSVWFILGCHVFFIINMYMIFHLIFSEIIASYCSRKLITNVNVDLKQFWIESYRNASRPAYYWMNYKTHF